MAYSLKLEDIQCAVAHIPEEMSDGICRELGRGANNRVLKIILEDDEGEEHVYALRKPRRRSDTQQRGNALWEWRHMSRAAELEVAPKIHSAWFARHAARGVDGLPSGLYTVSERYSHTMEDMISTPEASEWKDELCGGIMRCLDLLASDGFFMYDLKPTNVVVRKRDDGTMDVRVIDYGRDFCEWKPRTSVTVDPTASTPNIDALIVMAEGDMSLVTHVLYAAMLVILSSTTTRSLHEDRTDHRMSSSERLAAHPLAEHATSYLQNMQGKHVALLRRVLRGDDVRGVLRHYHGRRCSGTRRTLALARGVEVC